MPIDCPTKRLPYANGQLWPVRPPLQEDELLSSDIVEHIQTFSDGIIGEAVTLLQTAAVAALKSGRERITVDLLTILKLKAKRLRVTRK
jgi:hypothetical protein